MFRFWKNSYKRVEDVIIEDADDVVIKDAEDIFIQSRAVRGDIEIRDVADVYVYGRNETVPTPYRDCVIDDSDDATVASCEDVLLKADSVHGDLTIKQTSHDVFVKQADDLVIKDVEDVRFEGGVDRAANVHVEDAEDAIFETGAVRADVTIAGLEDIRQRSSDSVRGEIRTQKPKQNAPVHLIDIEDALIGDDAIDGTVIADDPDAVISDDTV